MTAEIHRPERRFQPRIPTDQQGSVLLMAPIPGVVKDMSRLGFCAEAWECLQINRDYFFTIGEAERNARLPGRVRWCRLIRTEKTDGGEVVSIFRFGITFLDFDQRGLTAPSESDHAEDAKDASQS